MSLPFYLTNPGPRWYGNKDVPWRSLDLETTNKDKGDSRNVQNRVVLACTDGKITDDGALAQFGERPVVMVAHNAKFELGWLARYGANIANILPWDTMIAEYVIAGNRQVALDLGSVAERYGLPGKDPLVDGMIEGGVCPSEIPEQWLAERVKYDSNTARTLACMQYEKLKERGLLEVFFTRCVVTPVLSAIEAEGLYLDPERVQVEFRKEADALATAHAALTELTGGINMRSRPQLGAFLYDTLKFDEATDRRGDVRRTATGNRLTDADTLASLRATTPEQRTFLKAQKAYAHSSDRLSKSLQFFQGACETQDGRILGQFNQCVTRSHRLSSSGKRIETRFGERGAQFQNMPREYKRLFQASAPGRVLAELDYAQLEFRIAVQLAGDVQGLADIASGHDVHTFTASVLKGKPMDAVTREERQWAKPYTFKPLYGGESGTARERAYYAAFRERYPQIAAMQREWVATALRTKQQVSPSGLIYYWPDTRVTDSGYVVNTASIYNYPIQAFATADVVLIGLTYLFWRLQGVDVRIVNTIHDSVILDLPAGDGAETLVAREANLALLSDVQDYVQAVYRIDLTVPLTGEYSIGAHWGEKELGSGTF